MKKTILEIEAQLAILIENTTLGDVLSEIATKDKRIIEDLHLDSLDYATVMLSCEKWLDSKVDEGEVNWREIQTIEQLAEVLFRSQRNE